MTRAGRWRFPRGADGSDFDSFYLRHVGRVHRFLLRRVQPVDADDISDQVFLAAWRRFDQIQGDPSHEIGWLFVTARQQLLNHFRSVRRRQRLEARLASHEQPAITVPNSFQSRDDFFTDPQYARAFARLSDDDRFILTLVAWDECTTDELSATLDCSKAAAKTRLSRARERFRQQMDQSRRSHTEEGDRPDERTV